MVGYEVRPWGGELNFGLYPVVVSEMQLKTQKSLYLSGVTIDKLIVSRKRNVYLRRLRSHATHLTPISEQRVELHENVIGDLLVLRVKTG